MSDAEFESCLERFERAWQRGPCELADYLGEGSNHDPSRRRRLLVELICVDLEFRWRDADGGTPVGLRDYVERFPELISIEHLPIELIGEEYRVRRRWGDRPSPATFMSRFRERRALIEDELRRIDAEILEESAEPRPVLSRGPRSMSALDFEDLTADLPLVAHTDFKLRRMIGAGSMGKVYEASQHSGGRDVAVKFLQKSFRHRPEVIRRFIGEARTIAKLNHPGIVGTLGLGRTPGGSCFIVMELVRGWNLAQVAVRRTVTIDEALDWIIQACDALAHAHHVGIVHCDLKPANLLLDDRGTIHVTDFGLARSLSEETHLAAEVEGTAPFMAPEQASRCWGAIDHRTDVYGIGAVLYTLLTDRPPILGRRLSDILASVASAAAVVSPLRLVPSLPSPLVEICRRCLAKEPMDRFQTIDEVRFALIDFCEAKL
jgi:tRNA A-37 threonylcarbamoyl transferase component Bud32